MRISTFIAQTAQRFSHRDACICADRRLSFGDLDARSNRVANALRAAGIGIGDRLLLFAPNSIEVAEVFAAALKAGVVTVPVSTRLGPAEIGHIVDDARPVLVACGSEDRQAMARAVGGRGVRYLALDGNAGESFSLEHLAREGTDAPPPVLPPQARAAAIVYTSGTTGKAKGAVVTHEVLAVQQLVNVVTQEISERDRILVATPLAHRNGLSRLVATFCSGAPLIIMPKFDPAETVRAANAHGATTLGAVTTIVRMLIEHLEATGQDIPTLRGIQVSGEAFPVDLKKRLHRLMPDVRLWTWYASTEAGVVSTLLPEEQAAHGESAGRPNPGMEVRLVDSAGRDVAPGDIAEIWVRCGEPGRGVVMEGYFGDPAATADAFVEGWLRTGDVGRMDADGYLHVVDRVKDMIVSGGLNVYAREVELCLLEHPAVREVAVVGVPDPAFGEAVYAFIVPRAGAQPTAEELAAHCTARIARYKRPRYFSFVEALPRNATGKVVKPELRARARAEIAPGCAHSSPDRFTGS
jgi:acyl-CoA synthetase (AMP-forming)/AMP-acid ligase II